jgi:phosphatidylserine decarboxylase
MGELKPIRFVNLDSGVVQEEEVYGGFWVKAMYGTLLGRMLSKAIAAPPFSRFFGWLQDRSRSKRKIKPFIKKFNINMSDFLPEEGHSEADPYSTFNQFFTRRVTESARVFAQDKQFPAPCDARYFAYASLDEHVSIPVKGSCFKASALLNHEEWASVFESGPGFIARLCPVDYHRFHFPDAGKVLDSWRIPGVLHSVNPWALAFRDDIFMINEREVTILETEQFGKLAYIEVGATCVGKIKQTYEQDIFVRGDEKGMFLFGGSTVIVIGERGHWNIDPRILEHTQNGVETYLKMGQALGINGETS